MKSLILVVSLLLLGSQPVPAAEPPKVGFDCWISPESHFITYFIRCIHDRGLESTTDAAADPEAAEALDAIHRLLHAGASTEELDRLVKLNAEAIQRDFFTSIRIFSYPSEWSWQAEQPQQLVQMLCPEGRVCRVFVRPD